MGARYSGYLVNISLDGEELYYRKEGNLSGNSKGFREEYPQRGKMVEFTLKEFY